MHRHSPALDLATSKICNMSRPPTLEPSQVKAMSVASRKCVFPTSKYLDKSEPWETPTEKDLEPFNRPDAKDMRLLAC